jgi:hypothetical protein
MPLLNSVSGPLTIPFFDWLPSLGLMLEVASSILHSPIFLAQGTAVIFLFRHARSFFFFSWDVHGWFFIHFPGSSHSPPCKRGHMASDGGKAEQLAQGAQRADERRSS